MSAAVLRVSHLPGHTGLIFTGLSRRSVNTQLITTGEGRRAACQTAALGARGLTSGVLVVGGVGQQRRRENMHAVLVEETQELCLLRFL